MGAFLLRIVIFGTVLLGVSRAQAACFRDVRSWEAVRNQLPAFMRQMNIHGVHNTLFMKGAFRISPVGARFLIEAKGNHLIAGRLDQSQYFDQVCVNGNRIDVVLADRRADTLIITPEGLKMMGHTFKLVNEKTYRKMMSRL